MTNDFRSATFSIRYFQLDRLSLKPLDDNASGLGHSALGQLGREPIVLVDGPPHSLDSSKDIRRHVVAVIERLDSG